MQLKQKSWYVGLHEKVYYIYIYDRMKYGLRQVEKLKYVGLMISENGGCEE